MLATPIIKTSHLATEQTLLLLAGMQIPPYDQMVVNETDPASIVITYKLATVTVATKTIVISGNTTTITVT